jgi:hypothetical protein
LPHKILCIFYTFEANTEANMRNLIILSLWALLSVFFTRHAEAQKSVKLKGNNYDALNLNISYGAHIPAGEWKKLFGPHFSIGGSLEYITHPENIILGLETYYNFGGTVKNKDLLIGLETVDGQIIGNDLQFANVELRERGQFTGLYIGKLFQTHPENRKEGIRTTFGAGYLWHKIRIQDDFKNVPQLGGDYRKGYDRLTGGFALNQFIGYQKLDRDRRFNFMAGLEFMQAYTRSIRDWNFDTGMPADKTRKFDFSFGVRLAWTLPFYVGMPSEDIFY